MDSAAYAPVLGAQNATAEEGGDLDHEYFQDEPNNHRIIEPLEMMGPDDDNDSNNDNNNFTDLTKQINDAVVWPQISLSITIWLVFPVLTVGMIMAVQITGRIWTCVLFSLHLTLSLIKTRFHTSELANFVAAKQQSQTNKNSSTSMYSDDDDDDDEVGDTLHHPTNDMGRPPSKGCLYFWMTSLPSFMDIILFGVVYPVIVAVFQPFFVDSDGTHVIDWVFYSRACTAVVAVGWIIVALRLFVGSRMLVSNCLPSSTYYLTTTYYMCQSIPIVGSCVKGFYGSVWLRVKACFSTTTKHRIRCWQIVTLVTTLLSTAFFSWTIYSLIVHFGPFEPRQPHENTMVCDPLDTTECSFPFPSMHHLRVDANSETGYMVNLQSDSFPTLKGRIPISTDFLNKLDGFSTMGPLLFYIEGMKESHDAYLNAVQQNQLLSQPQPGLTRLRGHQEIELSLTPYSTTLLVDVQTRELVPHSAEIDYLDPERPSVMVFPAAPLKHNAHYAVAVINATDALGNRLQPTPGMVALFSQQQTSGGDAERYDRFTKTVLPALEAATHKVSANDVNKSHDWGGPFGAFLRSHDPESLQLLFDFQTASKATQLGPVRAVRDATIKHIESQWTQPWQENHHVRVIRQIEGDCNDPSYPLARTIHGELDVPWFLTGFGSGYRDSILDPIAVKTGVPTTIGQAKFVVHIPCSLKVSALHPPTIEGMKVNPQPLRAVVEYGHGLFNNRDEAGDSFLIKMANENGYIITAMDWRGMSQYDMPLVLRTMLAKPSLFESLRDNLIQGYANKFALQHFTRNGMLDLPWFEFSHFHEEDGGTATHKIPQSLDPLEDPNLPRADNEAGVIPSIFYGISQGGILGAGYLGLSGSTGLITRGALGVPGSPFSLVLSRSLEFVGYDLALLLNFYNNRHVRIFLSLAQMCWDSVEGSGVLGLPVEEPVPPVVLQAGLGDPIVPTLAAERLARALGAQILPHNPRSPIYAIPQGQPADDKQTGPTAVLTEMLYQKDFERLPEDDELTAMSGNVHFCVRQESVMQHQLNVFFQSGRIIDPCAETENACVRESAVC